MNKTALIILVLLTLARVGHAQRKPIEVKTGWTSVYAHDEKGNHTSGSMDELMNGLRKGYSLKIGWSWTRQLGDSTVTLEHFAEPIFVTIIQQKHVSAIINPHPLLKNYIDRSKQEFDNPANLWQCVLTTEGKFNAMVYNRTTGEIVKDWPQRHKMVWYLEYP
jgi:hypothetical protein